MMKLILFKSKIFLKLKEFLDVESFLSAFNDLPNVFDLWIEVIDLYWLADAPIRLS